MYKIDNNLEMNGVIDAEKITRMILSRVLNDITSVC